MLLLELVETTTGSSAFNPFGVAIAPGNHDGDNPATRLFTTYNAYLIIDEKITLIDTVKATLKDEMLKRISDIIDPAKIDYIVSNHVEMDHSGAIPDIINLATEATIITCPNGEKGL